MILQSEEKIQIKKLQLSSANQITPFWSDFSLESKLTTANVSKMKWYYFSCWCSCRGSQINL
jgi:hypothetical protein